MRDEIFVVNEKDLIGSHKAEHQPYEYVRYEVTSRKDFNQCYVALYEIPPMKANYPYHYHLTNTEVFYIISGQGILRTPTGDRSVKAGDFIVCPPTANGAHKLMNNSESETLKYIDFDTSNTPDIISYPDSNKTGVIIRDQGNTFFKNEASTDYYDGE